MPLNWNISEVENYEDLWEEIESGPEKGMNKLNAVTEYLTYATMYVGISKITEDNYEKFYNRLLGFEHVRGKHLYEPKDDPLDSWKERNIKKSEVKRHIGLWTNASNKSEAKFKKDLIDWVEQKFGPFG